MTGQGFNKIIIGLFTQSRQRNFAHQTKMAYLFRFSHALYSYADLQYINRLVRSL